MHYLTTWLTLWMFTKQKIWLQETETFHSLQLKEQIYPETLLITESGTQTLQIPDLMELY